MRTFVLAGGCFWCLDAVYRTLEGVTDVVSGYSGGSTPNPDYESVCTGTTGHAEVVAVTFDETVIPAEVILDVFFTLHDPRQLNRQGNDVGTQYRSAIYFTTPEQEAAAYATRDLYAAELARNGYGAVTTEIRPAGGEPGPDGAGPFYYAEAYHQQYLHKVPGGYCPVHSTGVACPLPA